MTLLALIFAMTIYLKISKFEEKSLKLYQKICFFASFSPLSLAPVLLSLSPFLRLSSATEINIWFGN
jgi:hypothetical protein